MATKWYILWGIFNRLTKIWFFSISWWNPCIQVSLLRNPPCGQLGYRDCQYIMIDNPCLLMNCSLHDPFASHYHMFYIIANVDRVAESYRLLKIFFPANIIKFRLVEIVAEPRVNVDWCILALGLSDCSRVLGKPLKWYFLNIEFLPFIRRKEDVIVFVLVVSRINETLSLCLISPKNLIQVNFALKMLIKLLLNRTIG